MIAIGVPVALADAVAADVAVIAAHEISGAGVRHHYLGVVECAIVDANVVDRPVVLVLVVGESRSWNDPLPPEAKDLDLVTLVAADDDVAAGKDDATKLDAAVFFALKHGGTFIVIDKAPSPAAVPLRASRCMTRCTG